MGWSKGWVACWTKGWTKGPLPLGSSGTDVWALTSPAESSLLKVQGVGSQASTFKAHPLYFVGLKPKALSFPIFRFKNSQSHIFSSQLKNKCTCGSAIKIIFGRITKNLVITQFSSQSFKIPKLLLIPIIIPSLPIPNHHWLAELHRSHLHYLALICHQKRRGLTLCETKTIQNN